MKKDIHPDYNKDAVVVCSCGNTFKIGSTMSSIKVEFCHKCHPFYTGEQKSYSEESRAAKFAARESKKSNSYKSRKEKMEAKKAKKLVNMSKDSTTKKTVTLKDLLESL